LVSGENEPECDKIRWAQIPKKIEMGRRIGTGKEVGLRAIANVRGVVAAIAIDQRSAMRALFAKAMGIEAQTVPVEKLMQFKEAVSRKLTPYASSILLDPEYGLTAARLRASSTGLLLAYEQTGYEGAARMPRLLNGWSVSRLVERGANGIKLLVYYSALAEAAVNNTKQAFIECVGAECAMADIPFFLELVTYAEGVPDKSAQLARLKPSLVADSIREFCKDRYQVDILKVGVPVDLTRVEGSPAANRDVVYRREQAIEHYRYAAETAKIPFVYLSEGVSNETFQFGLELATEAGAKFSGILCGRATWKDGVPVFVEKGEHALEDWLEQDGVRNIRNFDQSLQNAVPWFAFNTSRPGAKE